MESKLSNNSYSSCQNFRANLWRPHTCTNCYKPKILHSGTGESITAKSFLKKLAGPTRPSKKELRQISSVATLDQVKVSTGEWEEMPERSHRISPMVGVVKPYAVVDIDEDNDETSLDGVVLKHQYTESGNQRLHNTKSSTLSVLRTRQDKNGSNLSLDKVGINGEAKLLETVPKPMSVLGKMLITEYQRSLNVTSTDKLVENANSSEDSKERYKRGKSVEPLETRRTQSISVKRSASLRQEIPKSSKLLSLLSRRKAASPSAHVNPLECGLQHTSKAHHPTMLPKVEAFTAQPKVTSPHPVRRNKATVHLYSHSLLATRKHKKEVTVVVPARPRNLSVSMKVREKDESPNSIEKVLKKRKRSPPAKPPRTLSTFFTSSDQEHLFQQLLECGNVCDEQVKRKMNSELQTVDKPSRIRPPRRLRPDGYDHVVRFPLGDSGTQKNVVSRLPLGHTGDYAEVLSSSGSVNEFGGLFNSVESNYDSLQRSPPTPPPREPPHFRLPVVSPPSHPLTQSQTDPTTPPTSTNTTPSQDEEELYSVPPQEESDYAVPCSSPITDKDTYSRLPCISPCSNAQINAENHYSLAYASPVEAPNNSELDTLMATTLSCVLEKEYKMLMCADAIREDVKWGEMEVISKSEVLFKGHTFSIKAVETLSAEVKQTIEISKLLKPHLNLSLVCSVLPPPLTPPTYLTPSPHYLITDHTGTDSAHFLLSCRHSLTPDAYADHILHTLTQLFSALKYLYENGVCHRDVGVESIYGRYVGGNWLVKLGEFKYALHRSGPVDATTFVYGYNELEWLGGVDSRLPPEVMDTPGDVRTVDYSHTDVFSVGCMVYELCSSSNPFETNSDLIFQQYTDKDLPELELDSKLTPCLQKLAQLLLKQDTSKRISASTGLLICQALKWLPREWLSRIPSEGEVRERLSLLRGQVVCEAAKKEEILPLDVVLEGQFLSECDVTELIKAISLFAVQ